MKTGVLGGTFDPVHRAHLVMAEEVKRRLDLDEILFVPAGRPWLKIDHSISPVEHRVQMVRLAVRGKPHFKLSTVEVERAGPTYTVDTIAGLRQQMGREDELFFILGWDSVAGLPSWREPSRLIEMCRLVAVPRPGYPPPDMMALESLIPGISERLVIMDKPELDISSSEIRERVARGLSIHDLVPRPVARYIKEHGLYTKESLTIDQRQ